jgi:hypothetical protein
MDSIYDTGFVVLAAGTAAAGALISLISYYVWGRPADAAPAAPGAAGATPASSIDASAAKALPGTAVPDVVAEPERQGEENAVLSPRSKDASSSSGSLLAVPSGGGSSILVSPIKERPRAPPRTLPSRGHHKARPAVDPRSSFQRELDEQATNAQQQQRTHPLPPPQIPSISPSIEPSSDLLCAHVGDQRRAALLSRSRAALAGRQDLLPRLLARLAEAVVPRPWGSAVRAWPCRTSPPHGPGCARPSSDQRYTRAAAAIETEPVQTKELERTMARASKRDRQSVHRSLTTCGTTRRRSLSDAERSVLIRRRSSCALVR